MPVRNRYTTTGSSTTDISSPRPGHEVQCFRTLRGQRPVHSLRRYGPASEFRAHDHVQHMDRQEAARANTRALRSEGACRMMLIEQKSSALVHHAFARVLQ